MLRVPGGPVCSARVVSLSRLSTISLEIYLHHPRTPTPAAPTWVSDQPRVAMTAPGHGGYSQAASLSPSGCAIDIFRFAWLR